MFVISSEDKMSYAKDTSKMGNNVNQQSQLILTNIIITFKN